MSDGFPDRLTQLRSRWQADRSSRIFLQLAEEYRHLGRVHDALEVLDAGLQEHPGYLSALVAKGRCLLEVGDAGGARVVLERVVQQDATQMVANKLLVRAHLETGEPERARRRLETYILLNDSDPEIEELQRRVVAMSRPPQDADEPRVEEPAERPHMDRTETPQSLSAGADVFDLGSGGPVLPPATGGEVFDLPPLAPLSPLPALSPSVQSAQSVPLAPLALLAPLAPTTPLSQTAAPPPLPSPPPLPPAGPPVRALARGEGNGAEPFPDLAPDHSHHLYLAGLAAGEIFSFQPPPPALQPVSLPPPAPAATAPAAAAEPDTPWSPAPSAAPPPEPPATAGNDDGQRVAAPRATATLGELYLRQGHLEEAESIFREVAAREPENAAARHALAQLSQVSPEPPLAPMAPMVPMAPAPPASAVASPAPVAAPVAAVPPPAPGLAADEQQETAPPPRLAAAELLAGTAPAATAAARKAFVLHGYLARLRQARRAHVP